MTVVYRETDTVPQLEEVGTELSTEWQGRAGDLKVKAGNITVEDMCKSPIVSAHVELWEKKKALEPLKLGKQDIEWWTIRQ